MAGDGQTDRQTDTHTHTHTHKHTHTRARARGQTDRPVGRVYAVNLFKVFMTWKKTTITCTPMCFRDAAMSEEHDCGC